MKIVETTLSNWYNTQEALEDENDNITLIKDLNDDEPVFVLRGNDVLTIPFLRQYQMFTEDRFGPEKGQSLERLIDRMREYQQHHADRVKFPD